MNEDQLNRLLHRADAAAGTPEVRSDLARWVLRQARRRQRLKAVFAGSGVLAIIVLAAVGLWLSSAQTSQTAGPSRAERLEAEIQTLQAKLRVQTMVVDHLLHFERCRQAQQRLQQALGHPDPLRRAARYRDDVALRIIWDADRKMRQGNLDDSARRDYQRVIELFGQSQWADVARTRLEQIDRPQGDAL